MLEPAFLAKGRQPNRAVSTLLGILSHDDLTWQSIYLHASCTKDADSVMPVEYSSIRSRFQTIFLAGQQRILQDLSCAVFHFREFCTTE